MADKDQAASPKDKDKQETPDNPSPATEKPRRGGIVPDSDEFKAATSVSPDSKPDPKPHQGEVETKETDKKPSEKVENITMMKTKKVESEV